MRKSATQEPSHLIFTPRIGMYGPNPTHFPYIPTTHLIFTPEEKEGRAGEDRLSGIAQKTALGTGYSCRVLLPFGTCIVPTVCCVHCSEGAGSHLPDGVSDTASDPPSVIFWFQHCLSVQRPERLTTSYYSLMCLDSLKPRSSLVPKKVKLLMQAPPTDPLMMPAIRMKAQVPCGQQQKM